MTGSSASFDEDVAAFVARHGEPLRVEVLLPDMNGRLRGKRLVDDGLAKLAKGAVRLPWGTQALDIWGVDVPEAGVGAEIGDPDGVCRPIPGTLGLADAPDGNSADVVAQVLATMDMPDGGGPCFIDPRVRLDHVVSKLSAKGLHPVVAVELEFYLVAFEDGDTVGPPKPPCLPGRTVRAGNPQVYDMEITDAFGPILADIAAECARLEIPAETAIAEFGPGQFEINLRHVDDALKAADHAILFKRVVRRVAEQHGYRATFMAKVYGDQVGNGCHVHASLLNTAGENIFVSSSDEPSEALQQATAGCLETAPDLMAIFAPHLNSYRRFAPGSFAPVQLNWGRDHRGLAVRLPEVSGAGARLEHRIAGADVNPYLMLAGVLAGMLHGLENKLSPGDPIPDGAREVTGPRLTHDWLGAIERFAVSDFVRDMFGADYQNVYSVCRRAEHSASASVVTDFEYETYLNRL